MLKKNQELISTVVGTGNNCEGVIKDENSVIFVPFCLPNEKVKVKILKVDKKCAFGKVIEVLNPSENRTMPQCSVFGKCGGCQMQHVKYAEQLRFKKQAVKDAFSKIAFIDANVLDVVSGAKQFRYRNKLQLPVAQTKNGLEIGFYAENSHRVIDVNDCLINPEWTKTIISVLKEYMLKNNLKGYDNILHKGDIREITVREVDGNLIIVLVCLQNKLTNVNNFIDLLNKSLNNNFSVYLNVNNSKSNVIYGEKFNLIYGSGQYSTKMLGIKHDMGVQSFMQVNSDVCKLLYSKVVDSIEYSKTPTVIDAYSGAGLMTALLAKKANRVFGIEIIPEAVVLANNLMAQNGLSDKVTNLLGKCEDILPELVEKQSELGDVCVVLDPPRKGCDINVIQALLKSKVSKIIYVSCKPQTLARDVGLLIGTLVQKDDRIIKTENVDGVYKLESVTPYDMFPNTKHIENVAILSRR